MAGFRQATPEDIAAVVTLMGAYYEQDGYPFDVETARAAVTGLTTLPALGALWVATLPGAPRVVGYLAVTLGYSLEYGGRDAFLDELYLTDEARSQGLGTEALVLAEAYCRERGVRALHLEVEHHRERAHALYQKAGYEEHERKLMTKLLT